ncbi:hypothetical protein IIA16_01985 [bacterium]|nr:hypothetical protein [bacterium]
MEFVGALLSPPVGMGGFSGRLAAGQAVYRGEVGNLQLTMAGGLLAFAADSGDSDSGALL